MSKDILQEEIALFEKKYAHLEHFMAEDDISRHQLQIERERLLDHLIHQYQELTVLLGGRRLDYAFRPYDRSAPPPIPSIFSTIPTAKDN